MACLERDVLHLVSRNENEFASFGELADRMARELTHKDAIRKKSALNCEQPFWSKDASSPSLGSPVVQRMFIANVIAESRRHIARSWPAVDPVATHGALERQGIKPDDLKARLFSSSHGGTS